MIRYIIGGPGPLVFRNFSQPNKDLQFGSITPPIDSKLGKVTPLLFCQTSAEIRQAEKISLTTSRLQLVDDISVSSVFFNINGSLACPKVLQILGKVWSVLWP